MCQGTACRGSIVKTTRHLDKNYNLPPGSVGLVLKEATPGKRFLVSFANGDEHFIKVQEIKVLSDSPMPELGATVDFEPELQVRLRLIDAEPAKFKEQFEKLLRGLAAAST